MFKITPNPTFTIPVAIPVPGGAGTETLKVIYKHLGRKKFNELVDKLKDITDLDLMETIIAGWEGADAPYSRETLDNLLDNYPQSGRALWEAYLATFAWATEKNSSTPPATGQS